MELLLSEKQKLRLFPFSFTGTAEFHWSREDRELFLIGFYTRNTNAVSSCSTPSHKHWTRADKMLQEPEPKTNPPSHIPAAQQCQSCPDSLSNCAGRADRDRVLPLCVEAHLDRDKVIEDNSAYEHGCSFESTNFLIMCYSSGGILDAIFFDIFMTHAPVEQSKLQFANASVYKFETGWVGCVCL